MLNHCSVVLFSVVIAVIQPFPLCAQQAAETPLPWTTRTVEGWNLHISSRFKETDQQNVARAIELLQGQLKEVIAVVPERALKKLQGVPLYFSPTYPSVSPGAEYHPGAGWLRDNGRDPTMAKGIEFTNISIFEEETRRMPNFALHELAHAFHDQVYGFNHKEIEALFERAKASGRYDRVQRQDAQGRLSWDQAYAITNSAEYFAETSEAFFSRNDFFPFNRQELHNHDPQMESLLEKLWNLESP